MRSLRRLLQLVALLGTLVVATLAVALIVSQTPWFRDWLRRYIVRESKQYLNGELSIGSLGGNLLFGVQVNDIAVDVSGERVVAVRNVEVDYSVFEIISSGVVMDRIRVVQPVVKLERDAGGWNLAQLVKQREREADREGPNAPLTLRSIEVEDARVVIEDRSPGGAVRLPARIDDVDLKASYEYAPVHYSIVIDSASARASSPRLSLNSLAGKVAVRDDNLYIEDLSIQTGESSLRVEGVVEQYLETPVMKLATSGQVSLPEVGRIVPAASRYPMHPQFEVEANGSARQLRLDLDVRSEAGRLRGQVTADVEAPELAARGAVDVERLNLAPLLGDPAQRSTITGRADLDVRVAAAPASRSILERLGGSFRFRGPQVAAAGYEARDVAVSGSFEGGRINIDGRAGAYGGTATARGFVQPPAGGRPLRFDLAGSADDVDVQGLPPSTGAPALATDLTVTEYRITGEGRTIAGSATLGESTVEGATVTAGTVADFAAGPTGTTFGATGGVAGLDLRRIGRAMRLDAIDKPAYEGHITGEFAVTGTVPARRRTSQPSRLGEMTIDASGTLRETTIMGGRLPHLAFEATLEAGRLVASVDGRFEEFDPSTLAGRQELDGRVSGAVKARAEVADLTAPVTPKTIAAEGHVTLERSAIGGLRIDAAAVRGTYAGEVADIAELTVTGPDLRAKAAGRLALDRTSSSDLRYHVEAVGLSELARLAGQSGVSGSAVVDGTLTGNAASLRTTGTLDGSNLGYRANTALDVDATYSVTVPDLAFANAEVEADTEATFVKAAGMEINSITAKTTYAEKRLGFTTTISQATRQLDATGDVVLHPDHQELHLPSFAVRTQGIEWTAPPGVEAAIRYGQDRIELENLRLVSGSQSLDVSGAFAVTGDAPAGTIKVKAANVDLQQLETLMLTERGLTGTLSADATVSGTAQAPVVEGRVEVVDGGFRGYRYESLAAEVEYAARGVTVDATLRQSPTETITAAGTVPLSLFRGGGAEGDKAGADPVDVRIQSTALGLGVVQGFTDQIANVSGTIEADVRVTGTSRDPELGGFVAIRDGAFGIPALGGSYTGLTTRIDLEPDRVRLQSFAILDEHGEPLKVSGEVAVDARKPGAVNIAVDSDNFEIIDNELGDVGIDSRFTVTGEVARPVVQGSIRLEAARLEVDRILQLFYDPYSVESLPPVVSAERSVEGSGSAMEATSEALRKAQTAGAVPATTERAEAGTVPAPAGAFAPVTLDIRLEIPDNLVLRGNDLRPGGPTGASLGDLNITVGGELQVVKPAGGQVLLLGTVRTVRGTYEFQGRRFALERGGTLRFMGEPQPNPALDITATRLIPNTGVEAQIRIQGTAKAPQLSLTSTPPLEESDVLALIVFNRPVNELGTGERASLAATAGGIATGFIAAPLGESIGRALDLDLFEITTTTDSGELGAGLTVGQQVGDRAFFKLRQQFGERSTTEFLLEYQLTDFLRAQGTAAPETSGAANRIGQRRVERAGIDLIFFFSY